MGRTYSPIQSVQEIVLKKIFGPKKEKATGDRRKITF
jgi:hypothetical protein